METHAERIARALLPMVTVFIPTTLLRLTRNTRSLEVEGGTIGEVIRSVDEQFPGFAEAVIEDGSLRSGLAVSIDSELATLGLMEPVPEGSEVHFLPAIGGG
jgi:molybdopterin synthase sulfur carrier subunit